MQRKLIKKEDLIKLLDDGLCDIDISKKLEVSVATILRHRKKYGLKGNFKKYKMGSDFNKKKLLELLESGMTKVEIAQKYGVTISSIQTYCRRYNITLDERSNSLIELSEIQKQVLFGTVLGDSYLSNDKTPTLSFEHSLKQKEYADYKASFFEEYGVYKYEYEKSDKRTDKKYKVYLCIVKSNPAFLFFKRIFYSPKKIIPIEILEEYYTPLAMAIHYMDDGGISKNNPQIATCSFNEKDIYFFINFLKKRYDLNCTLNHNNRVYIKKDSIDKFFEIIRPYVIPSMQYKLIVS